MLKDEHRSIYVGALGICAVALTLSAFLARPLVDAAAIRLETTDFGAIETASTPQSAGPNGAENWNYPAIPWRSYEEGLAQAERENKPALLVLQASWCLMCRDYQKLFETPEVEAYADDYVFILSDIDDSPELQRRYNVDGDYIPRTFVLSPDGDVDIDAQGGFGGHRYFVDPYRVDALAEVLRAGDRQR